MGVTIEPGFHPAQEAIATSPARFRVVAAGRRTGKTRLAVTEAYKTAIAGGRAWWIAPTFTMGLEAWRPAVIIAREIPGAQVHIMEKEIVLPGGGVIQWRSADTPSSLRGAGLDLVVVDEAAFIRELQDLWEQVLRPSLSDRKGRALLISTPKGIGNAFHQLWQGASSKPDWAAFQFPTSANPHIDPVEIEAARGELGGLVFAQEYLGEFVELGGTLFRTDWERLYEVRDVDGVPRYSCGDRLLDSREGVRFVTVDLAASTKSHADYTAMAACQSVDGVLVVLEIVRRRMEGPDILPRLRELMERHNIPVAHMESAGFQLSLVQQARREGLAVRELKADKDKIARALPLQARMEAGGVWFLKDAPWLKDLELELFGFPASEHDDQVDALAYAALVAGEQKRERVGLEGLEGFGVRVSPNRVD